MVANLGNWFVNPKIQSTHNVYVIIERSRGVVAWIRFGEEGVSTLLKGVEVLQRKGS